MTVRYARNGDKLQGYLDKAAQQVWGTFRLRPTGVVAPGSAVPADFRLVEFVLGFPRSRPDRDEHGEEVARGDHRKDEETGDLADCGAFGPRSAGERRDADDPRTQEYRIQDQVDPPQAMGDRLFD